MKNKPARNPATKTPASRYAKWIDGYLQKTACGGEPNALYEPIRYILSLGGKRLRPALALMSYGLYKKDVKKILPYAAAIEIFHNFTLMHDDIMDNAPLRRDKPSVHAKWSVSAAILSGDAMLIDAYQRWLSLPDNQLRKALKLFSQCALQVCEGQQLDMMFERRECVSPEEYENMIRLKTAALLGFSLELGAALAGAPAADCKRLRQAGIDLGMAFQLADDWLDAYGGKAFGKQIGGDIIAHKKTFLLTQAWHRATPRQRSQLKRLNARHAPNREKIQSALRLYRALNLSAIAQAHIERYFARAIKSLEKINADKNRLSELTRYVLNLKNRIT